MDDGRVSVENRYRILNYNGQGGMVAGAGLLP
jgi:hypothetical protein